MILLWFSRRWLIEVTFLDSKQHLGLDEAENRKTKAVRRPVSNGAANVFADRFMARMYS